VESGSPSWLPKTPDDGKVNAVTEQDTFAGKWALILGASSGFGAATARALARKGMHIFGVHLDRSSTLHMAEQLKGEIEAIGRHAVFFNTNAASDRRRAEVLDRIESLLAEQGDRQGVRVLFHSLAFGTLRDFVPENRDDAVSRAQMEMTLDVMANSLVYWAQDLVYRGLMGPGSRIFAMTSSGSRRVLPSYGAVSAAKSALESHIRQLAADLAQRGITANAVRAGITDTRALRVIPGAGSLIIDANSRNPMGRATTPEDVAAAVSAMCVQETYWLTGDVLGVDGGEMNAGG
jgi:NAD(P)-dependent dehydrogenase (short-subunit alcohol dehydrogenase family)